LEQILGFALVIGIIYVLYSKGIIKNPKFPIVRVGYKYNHLKNRKLDISYTRFNGVNNYPFLLKKGKEVTLRYNVSVQAGSLKLIFRDQNKNLLEKEFQRSEKGTLTFIAESRVYSIELIGHFTRGGCKIRLEPVENVIES